MVYPKIKGIAAVEGLLIKWNLFLYILVHCLPELQSRRFWMELESEFFT